MGIVYLALVGGPGGFNKLFVVKELKSHLAEDPNLVSMFVEEARLAAKLSHPNVVQTIEVGSDWNRHFIAMEYLDGQSLNRVLNRVRRSGTPFPLPYQLYVIAQLLDGLQYAHRVTDFDGTALNLVHRDVSPHNVFVTYDGQVKVLDFGIAKALDSANDTRTGVLKGKVAYMAPEQSAGQPIDQRADLFSVGVMLWEAAVGERMWKHTQNDLQILHALMSGKVPRPRDAKPDIDPPLEQIILKATATNAADRYASAAEFRAEIEAYLDGLGHPSFGPREIGKFLADAFVQERTQIKGVIDDQLRLLRAVTSGEYGAIDLPLLSAGGGPSGTPSGAPRGAPASNPSIRMSSSIPSFRAPFDLPVQQGGSGPLAPLRNVGASPGTMALVSVVALLVFAAVAGVTVLALRRPPPERASAGAASPALLPPSSTAEPVPPAPPAPAPVPSSPPESRSEASAVPDAAPAPPTHAHARSEAHAAPSAPESTPPAPPPAPAAPAPSPAAPSVTAHAKQQIDTRDPYAN
jgi:serine/threonine protein kinase